jgi:hypothetical protein
VVFEWGEVSYTDLVPAVGPKANKSNDANLSDNKEKTAGYETSNRMPGFIFFVRNPKLLMMRGTKL